MKNKLVKKILLAMALATAVTTATVPATTTNVCAYEDDDDDWDYDDDDDWDERNYVEKDSICSDTGAAHNWVLDPDESEDATCVRSGYNEYECSDCGSLYKETTEPTGVHTFSGFEYKAITKGTMDSDGEGIIVCDGCFIESDQHIVIPKIGIIKVENRTYDGEADVPFVTVRDRNGDYIIHPDDYTLSGDAKSVGTHTVTLDFTDSEHYDGIIKKSYQIIPKGTKVSSITAGKKSLTVKWKKQSTQTSGYQVQYAKNKKFTGAKTVTIAKNSATSKKINKLSAKKTYYVRIRTYKTVNGKKICSNWSTAKTKKTK